jgi:hypothetical protein
MDVDECEPEFSRQLNRNVPGNIMDFAAGIWWRRCSGPAIIETPNAVRIFSTKSRRRRMSAAPRDAGEKIAAVQRKHCAKARAEKEKG